MSGWFPLFAPAVSGFNGGKTQTNFVALNNDGDYVTINAVKRGSDWRYYQGAKQGWITDPLDRDANGYPKTVLAGSNGHTIVMPVPSVVDRPGSYVMKWTGNGTVNPGGTLLTYAITGATAVANSVLTITLPSTGNQLKVGQSLAISGSLSGGTWNTISGNTYQILDAAVGGDPTKIQINLNASSLGTWSSGGVVNNTGTTTTGSGRCLFAPIGNGSFPFGISSLVSSIADAAPNHIRDVVVCYADHEALYDAGQIFDPFFKQKLREANFGVLRFLNWHATNLSQVTTWASNKSTSYFSWAAEEWRQSFIPQSGMTTAGSGAAYTLAFSGFTLTDKAVVSCFFDRDNAGACTLNVNGTGAINMLNQEGTALSINSNSLVVGNVSTSYATLIYDAAANVWIKQGGCSLGPNGFNNGCPIEILLQLCVEVGAHPWIITPTFACTPMTDWLPSMAYYMKTNAPSWMRPRYEGPNEQWNTFGGFEAAGYSNLVATAYGWGADFHNWYGKVISTIGQAVTAVYGGSPKNITKYHVVCGIQTAGPGPASSDARLASTKYIGTTPQSPLVGAWGTITFSATVGVAEAYRWVTHVAMANYFSSKDYGQAAEATDVANWSASTFTGSISGSTLSVPGAVTGTALATGMQDSGFGVVYGTTITGGGGTTWTVTPSQNFSSGAMTAGDPTARASNLAGYMAGCGGTASGGTPVNVAQLNVYESAWATWANSFGVTRMCCYEGGYSPDYGSLGPSATDQFRAASKSVSALQGYTTTVFNDFTGVGAVSYPGGFVAEFPSNYLFGGPRPSTLAWSIMDDIFQPNSPQMLAIKAFNN